MELEETTEMSHEETTDLLVKAWEIQSKLLDMTESAWGIIANAYGGEWDKAQNKDWHPAAIRWRDSYHEILHELLHDLPTPTEDAMVERMADEVHQVWCVWMEYMFGHGSLMSNNGPWVMNEVSKLRWARQMITPYAQLSEEEKQSDREIAQRYLDITLLKEVEDELR